MTLRDISLPKLRLHVLETLHIRYTLYLSTLSVALVYRLHSIIMRSLLLFRYIATRRHTITHGYTNIDICLRDVCCGIAFIHCLVTQRTYIFLVVHDIRDEERFQSARTKLQNTNQKRKPRSGLRGHTHATRACKVLLLCVWFSRFGQSREYLTTATESASDCETCAVVVVVIRTKVIFTDFLS